MTDKKRGIKNRLADLLNPYSWITATRNMLFDAGVIKSREFDVPTICIGNITVGGTGKTPHTEYIVKLFHNIVPTAVLSRGYGRKSKGYMIVRSDTPMEQAGDEPLQIKNKFKDTVVAVCEKRVTGIERILKEFKETGLILLDDAFQHRHVIAGLNILLIDFNRPIWKDCILPFGRMRESIAGVRRANVVIMTKCCDTTTEERKECKEYIQRIKDIPLFFSGIRYGKPYNIANRSRSTDINGKEVLLVTGIANPEPLKREIEKCGARVKEARYSDHYNFTSSDIKEIEEWFSTIKGKEKVILTTEKDATRLVQRNDITDKLKECIFVMPIEVKILYNEEKKFNQILMNYVTENSGNSRIP